MEMAKKNVHGEIIKFSSSLSHKLKNNSIVLKPSWHTEYLPLALARIGNVREININSWGCFFFTCFFGINLINIFVLVLIDFVFLSSSVDVDIKDWNSSLAVRKAEKHSNSPKAKYLRLKAKPWKLSQSHKYHQRLFCN